jgi:hypothetical protein
MRHQDATVLVIIFDILSACRATKHVHGVVMTPKQSIGAEIAGLFAGVTCDVSGKDHFQPPPSFAVFLPRLDLDGLESGIGVKEGLCKIRPERITIEVRGMKPIPGCIVLVSSECAAGILA